MWTDHNFSLGQSISKLINAFSSFKFKENRDYCLTVFYLVPVFLTGGFNDALVGIEGDEWNRQFSEVELDHSSYYILIFILGEIDLFT